MKTIPIATFFIILASSIKLAIFYSVFKINIVDYIGVSEYIPLFIDDLHGLLLIVSGSIIGIAIFKVSGMKPDTKEEVNARVDNKAMRILWIILVFILVIIAGFGALYCWPTISEKLEMATGFYIGIMCCVFMVSTTYKNSSTSLYLIALLSLIFVPLVLSGYTDAYTILDNRNEEEYQIFFERDTVITNNKIHYLGKSQDYLFIYNSQEEEAIIKQNKHLKEIRITKKIN